MQDLVKKEVLDIKVIAQIHNKLVRILPATGADALKIFPTKLSPQIQKYLKGGM